MSYVSDSIQTLASLGLGVPAVLWKTRQVKYSFDVVRGRSPDCDSGTGTPLSEHSRVLAIVADLKAKPEPGDAIDIGTDKCVVASVFSPPTQDGYTIGISRCFRWAAEVTGTRRENGAARSIHTTVPCFAQYTGDRSFIANGFAPNEERDWSIHIRRTDWPDNFPPQIGDKIKVNDENFPVMRVEDVNRDFGVWTLTCMSEEDGHE